MRTTEKRAAVIEDPARPATLMRQMWRTLVALFATMWGALLLPSRHAAATATFTVDRTGDAADTNLANDRSDSSTISGDPFGLGLTKG